MYQDLVHKLYKLAFTQVISYAQYLQQK
jgi:hypothetical protein